MASSVFAVSEDECAGAEINCLTSCCTHAGGVIESTNADGVVCSGATTGDPRAVEDAFSDCSALECRPAVINCVAPGSSCAAYFSSCYGSCKNNNGSIETCDDRCLTSAQSCVSEATRTSSGCLPAGLLGSIAGLSFLYSRRKKK